MVHFAEINQAPPPTQCCSILAEQRHRNLCHETVSDACKQHWLNLGAEKCDQSNFGQNLNFFCVELENDITFFWLDLETLSFEGQHTCTRQLFFVFCPLTYVSIIHIKIFSTKLKYSNYMFWILLQKYRTSINVLGIKKIRQYIKSFQEGQSLLRPMVWLSEQYF